MMAASPAAPASVRDAGSGPADGSMTRYRALAGSRTTTDGTGDTDETASSDRGIGATVVPGSRVDRTAATVDAAAPAAGRYRTVGTLTGPSVPAIDADTPARRPAASSDRTSAD